MKKMNFSYNVIGDMDELKWFYDHVVVKPGLGESLLLCHSARRKHCTPEEIAELKLGRSEMFHTEVSKARANQEYKWEDFLGSVYKFETNKYAYTTSTYQPYPDKTLVLFLYLNPCSEAAVVLNTKATINAMEEDLFNSCLKKSWEGVEDSLYKLSTITNHVKSCHAQSPSRRVWIDFDIDADLTESDYPVIHEVTEQAFGKGNFIMVKTAGGMHVFVKKDTLKFNPLIYTTSILENVLHAQEWTSRDVTTKKGDIVYCGPKYYRQLVDEPQGSLPDKTNKEWELLGEVTKNDNTMCAVPGTYQYGEHIVRVVNKEDFN